MTFFDEIQLSGGAQVQRQPIKMQEKRPSLNQHQTWMPSGFDCDVFKFVKITQLNQFLAKLVNSLT